MRPDRITLAFGTWSLAFLGCASFLLLGLVPNGSFSVPLVGQLSWLALLGSIPTALVLAATGRVARSRPATTIIVALFVALIAAIVSWEHTDFLLSGPHWMFHPQRGLARGVLAASLGVATASGWWWLLVAARTHDSAKAFAWAFTSALGVGILTFAISKYRAYDYTMAQALLPGGLLCAGTINLLGRRSGRWNVVLVLAIAGALPGLLSRAREEWVTIGEREVVAHSRAGGLATIYLLPHFARREARKEAPLACPDPRPEIEQSPLAIKPGDRRNVIIVTVDALRNDVVGAFHEGTALTPELSLLSEDALRFENATTTYPATLFAIGSAFTGKTPAELYLSPTMPNTVFTRSRTRVERQVVILPDVSWFRLPIVTEFLTPGVAPSFAGTDAAATAMMVEQLRDSRIAGDSVMAWIHYYAPHDPYRTHRPFPFGTGRRNAYMSEVAYFDQHFGRLMRYLRDEGWLEDSLVIFFSDHGEALGEEGYFGHHVYLNAWMVDVPLMLWHADLAPGTSRVGVSVADVAPTILHFLGLPQPADDTARSLFALMGETSTRPTFSEAFPVRGRALFDSFRLPALDDQTIQTRLESIRIGNQGYEPKGAITLDGLRLIHHRSADEFLVYERGPDGETLLSGSERREASARLREQMDAWEREQIERIQCKLRVSADQPVTPDR